jgi:hypothetical protein
MPVKSLQGIAIVRPDNESSIVSARDETNARKQCQRADAVFMACDCFEFFAISPHANGLVRRGYVDV